VVVLSNRRCGAADTAAWALISIAMRASYAAPARLVPGAVGLEVLDTDRGDYEILPGLSLAVTVEDGCLWVQLTGQERFPAVATSATRFVVRAVDAELRFGRDERGAARVTVRQHGRELTGRKRGPNAVR